MNTPPKQMDLTGLLSAFYRRKGVIIATFLVVSSLTAYLVVNLPNVFRSSTLVLITPQRLPSSYIQSTVTTTIQERIQTITQEILSRTTLEKIVQDFNLYSESIQSSAVESRVERLRRSIKIDAAESGRRNERDNGASFKLSYESDSPEKAMQVTARLASLFIEQNLKAREEQAVGTTAFINAELERLRKELEEQESKVNLYKARNQYELPDQLDANLRMLEQLRNELQANLVRLASLQERKAAIEKQLAEVEVAASENVNTVLSAQPAQNPPQDLEIRRRQLAALLAKYSEGHPEVKRLRQEIQALEFQPPMLETTLRTSTPIRAAPSQSPIRQTLLRQVSDLNSEVYGFQAKNSSIQGQLGVYQSRIEGTPQRGIELSKISRNYDITLNKFQDLLAKKVESELSENMEKKQKGEQFQLIDPASFPRQPIRPNRPQILLMGLVGGLAAGFGLAFLLENLNTSFKRADEMEAYIDLPLLATIPAVLTRESLLEQRRAQGILILASVGVMGVGTVLIRFFAPLFF